jgi:ubiquitin-protein ligase
VSGPRNRRLTADYADLTAGLTGNPVVEIETVSGAPPSAYVLVVVAPGIHRTPDGGVVRADRHRIRIDLPLGYPRQPPLVTAVSPIFHPNVAHHVCVADEWSPVESLMDVLTRVVDLVQFRTVNLDSPLDPLAATYVQQNPALFPLGDVRLAAPEADVQFVVSTGSPHASTSGGTGTHPAACDVDPVVVLSAAPPTDPALPEEN